ncbi:unnamed protein product [Brassicogethes aeneus]|uniref:Sulfatase-modifying factor enzyme-like domain-containing protein n=1 Tax=Brassicogethes aeneus TaxID=1431903 RepID=A0A9P0B805_BRAAE|nr:unnamed protein product [Brassicogethes aeneus]
MYLYTILIIFVLNVLHCTGDCGCSNLNREKKCKIDEDETPSGKYSRELNDNINAFNTYNMVLINKDTFEMGTNKPVFESDHEGPVRNKTVESFYLDIYEVSNQNFKDFVEKTGYKTEAETYGDSFVFEMILPESERKEYQDVRAVQAPWWIKLKDISWLHPEGPHSTIENKLNHPVIHVSWNDAVKYCEFFNKRLPTEAEWEMACRAGLKQKLYPWGNKLNPKGKQWANIWQGNFPEENTAEDGYQFTSPVDEFPPNKFGLFNMAGNVWEWTQDDWLGDSESKVKKGGSFLCHESYCYRYRCAARSFNTKDTSAGNLGFRCAMDIQP